MEFRILGPTEVLDGGRRVPLPSGRGRALLVLLVLHAGQPVSADRLIDELWGEGPPPTARTVVHGLVSKLRGLLEPSSGKARLDTLLQTFGSGYRLAIEPDAVDAHRFKQLIDGARVAPAEVRAARLSEALALWRGPALADFSYEPFAQRAITALEELRTQAIEDRIDADLASGCSAELVPELEPDHPDPSVPRAAARFADGCPLPFGTPGGRPPGVPRRARAAGGRVGPRTQPCPP